MAGRLVCAGVDAEGHEERARIFRGVNVGTTVVVAGVGVEEAYGELLVDVNGVSINADGVKGGSPTLGCEFKTLTSNNARSRGNSY